MSASSTVDAAHDVLVIGAGLAGSELAFRLAQQGHRVQLVTQSLDSVAALYGDLSSVYFPADSKLARIQSALPEGATPWDFHRSVKERLEHAHDVHLLQSLVTRLDFVEGGWEAQTWEGPRLRATRVVLACGAFLQARLRIGNTTERAGRLSEVAYDDLYNDLVRHGVAFETLQRRCFPSGSEDNEEGAYVVSFSAISANSMTGLLVSGHQNLFAIGQVLATTENATDVLMQARLLAQVFGKRVENA